MKSKIHTHSWADSTNESCSFCGKDMTRFALKAMTAQCVIYK